MVAPYSTVEHVASIVLPGDWQRVQFAVFTVAFDAGGKEEDQPVVVVAGLVSSAKDWAEFSVAWQSRLNQDGILYFHGSEFAHSTKQFAGWKGEEAKRRALYGDLIELMVRFGYHKFGCVAYLSELTKIPTDIRDFYHLRAFVFAARASAWQVREWKTENRIQSPIEHVFEEGDDDWTLLKNRFFDDGYPEPIRRPKKDRISKQDGSIIPAFVPLQAADLIAYEYFHLARQTNMENPLVSKSDLRWGIKELERIQGHVSVVDMDELNEKMRIDAETSYLSGLEPPDIE